jgi:hypothetical protein
MTNTNLTAKQIKALTALDRAEKRFAKANTAHEAALAGELTGLDAMKAIESFERASRALVKAQIKVQDARA